MVSTLVRHTSMYYILTPQRYCTTMTSLTVCASKYETSIITLILKVCIQFCLEYDDVKTHFAKTISCCDHGNQENPS